MAAASSPSTPNNSSCRSEMNAKVTGNLLVGIAACRMGGNDGGISVLCALLDFLQRWWLGAAVRNWDLHVIPVVLNMVLHPGYKLFIARKELPV